MDVSGDLSLLREAISNPASDPETGIGGNMEPLVIFGAGLVIYCGYLAAIDEIRDFKRCYSRHKASRGTRMAKSAKNHARPVAAKGGAYAGNPAYARGGRLLAAQAR